MGFGEVRLMPKTVYAIYEKDTGITFGIYDSYREAAEEFDCHPSTIFYAAKRGTVFQQKYLVEKIEMEDEENDLQKEVS